MIIHPNNLTALRIVIIPILAVCFFWDFAAANYVCFGLFVVAAITDFFDGYLARKYNLESKLGAFLDPVADKLIVIVSLLLLVSSEFILSNALSSQIFITAVIIIAAREILISALREWMASQGKRDTVAVSSIGKWKTTVQMIAIGGLFLRVPVFGLPVLQISEVLLYIAAILTLWSMMIYLFAAWDDLLEK